MKAEHQTAQERVQNVDMLPGEEIKDRKKCIKPQESLLYGTAI